MRGGVWFKRIVLVALPEAGKGHPVRFGEVPEASEGEARGIEWQSGFGSGWRCSLGAGGQLGSRSLWVFLVGATLSARVKPTSRERAGVATEGRATAMGTTCVGVAVTTR